MAKTAAHTSAAALWPELKSKAGLTGQRNTRRGSYDQDLLDSLRASLFPGEDSSIDKLMAASDLSAEQLLRAFFATLQPFALMQRDVLEMLSAAGAAASGDSLPLTFHFDPESDPLDLLLGDFRRQTEMLSEVLAPAMSLPTYQDLWEIPRTGTGGYSRHLSHEGATPSFASWLSEYERGRFPILPEDWRTGRSDVDDRLERAVRLADMIIEGIRAHAADRSTLHQIGFRDEAVQAGVADFWTLAELAQIESDYWLSAAVGWLSKMRSAEARSDEAVLQAMMGEIDRLLPPGSVPTRQTLAALEDILDLPVWKHRHDLYAVWLGSQIFRALRSDGWRFSFNLSAGRLEFAFRGVHLATLTKGRDKQVLDWWTELETPHDSLPSGRRRRAIKPDYRIRRRPAPGAGSSTSSDLLVLEAKQHLRSASAEFADALNDYAFACPDAVVILANHGPVSDRVMERCDPAHSARCHVVGRVHPGAPATVTALNRLLVTALKSALSGSLGARPGFVRADVRLEWGPSPLDLDLHVRRQEVDDQRVYYGQLSAAGLRHHGDITTGAGPEMVTIDGGEGTFFITVERYSSDGSLGASGARLSITASDADGHDHHFAFDVPASLSGGLWSVALINMDDGVVTEADEVVPVSEP